MQRATAKLRGIVACSARLQNLDFAARDIERAKHTHLTSVVEVDMHRHHPSSPC